MNEDHTGDPKGDFTAAGAPAKKPYKSPTLQEWGSIIELTGGSIFDVDDGNFGGSGGT